MIKKASWKGRFFEDFEVGDVYRHPLGRTILSADNTWFTLLTQAPAPIHLLRQPDRVEEAYRQFHVRAGAGHRTERHRPIAERVCESGLGQGRDAQAGIRGRHHLLAVGGS
jgi:acyl dehydratase